MSIQKEIFNLVVENNFKDPYLVSDWLIENRKELKFDFKDVVLAFYDLSNKESIPLSTFFNNVTEKPNQPSLVGLFNDNHPKKDDSLDLEMLKTGKRTNQELEVQKKRKEIKDEQNTNMQTHQQPLLPIKSFLLQKLDLAKKLLEQCDFNLGKEALCSNGWSISQIQGSAESRLEVRQLTLEHPSLMNIDLLEQAKKANLQAYHILYFRRLGHVLNLEEVKLCVGRTIVNLEGFHEVFTLPMIHDSLCAFAQTLGSHQQALFKTIAEWVLHSAVGEDLLKEPLLAERLDEKIKKADGHEPVLLCIGYNWHGTAMILFGDDLIYSERSKKKSIRYYQNGARRVTKTGVEKLLNRTQLTSDQCIEETRKIFSAGQTTKSFDLPEQKTGNCTYINNKSLVWPLLAIALYLESGKEQKKQVLDYFEAARPLYKSWVRFDKERVLKKFMQDYKNEPNNFFFQKTYEKRIKPLIEKYKKKGIKI